MNIMGWIQNRMKQAMYHYDAGRIPAWLLMVVHLTWWVIGFIVVWSLFPFVKLYMTVKQHKEEGISEAHGN